MRTATAEISPTAMDFTPSDTFVTAHRAQLETLMDALDLSRPELAEVNQTYAHGDLSGACTALLRYYQSRPAVPIQAKSSGDYLREADSVLLNTFSFQGVTATQPETKSGGLDWVARGPRDDPEWAWMLNRHGYFTALALAWQETKDGRYAAKVSSLLIDWVESNPYPRRLNFSSSWRALETARRVLDSWPLTWQLLQNAAKFTPEARLLMLRSLLDHADLLQHYASFWGGNHLLTEKTAIAQLAVAWPEFRQSGSWLNYAIQNVQAEILDQTYPDGSYKELTDHYQRVVMVNLDSFLHLCRDAGRGNQILPLEQRMEIMWHYYTGIMQPNGYGPLTNAADRENISYLAETLMAPDSVLPLARAANPDFRRAQSTIFPYAGQAVLRSSWSSDAVWAFLDAGPFGTAHQHQDRMHLDLSFGQQEILVDAGRYTYQPGPWLEYFKGPRSHNTLMLDGRSVIDGPLELTKPMSLVSHTGDGWAYVMAESQFPAKPMNAVGQTQWRRGVLLLPDESGVMVLDEVIGYGYRPMEARWHFSPDLSVHRTQLGLSAEANGVPQMQLVVLGDAGWSPAVLAKGQEEPEIAGWYAPNYNLKLPATEAEFSASLIGPSLTAWWFHNSSNGSKAESVFATFSRQGSRTRITLQTGRYTTTVELSNLEDGPSLVQRELK